MTKTFGVEILIEISAVLLFIQLWEIIFAYTTKNAAGDTENAAGDSRKRRGRHAETPPEPCTCHGLFLVYIYVDQFLMLNELDLLSK